MEWVLGITVGLLVGGLGIGGVLIVPVLSLFLGRELEQAIATASTSFLLPAAVATFVYHRRRAIPWHSALPMCVAVLPGVALGVGLGTLLPTTALALATSALLFASGGRALRAVHADGSSPPPERRVAVPIAFGVGAASALTGTGGPVLLTPLLLGLRVPVRTVVGLSQAIALPIAAAASVLWGVTGRVDFELAAILGVAQAAAVPVGAEIAQRLPVKPLHTAVALAILVSAALLALRALTAVTPE